MYSQLIIFNPKQRSCYDQYNGSTRTGFHCFRMYYSVNKSTKSNRYINFVTTLQIGCVDNTATFFKAIKKGNVSVIPVWDVWEWMAMDGNYVLIFKLNHSS